MNSVTCKTIGTVSRVRDTIGIVDRIPNRWKSLRLHWMEEAHGHHITCGTMWPRVSHVGSSAADSHVGSSAAESEA